jgi:hypothetical protein
LTLILQSRKTTISLLIISSIKFFLTTIANENEPEIRRKMASLADNFSIFLPAKHRTPYQQQLRKEAKENQIELLVDNSSLLCQANPCMMGVCGGNESKSQKCEGMNTDKLPTNMMSISHNQEALGLKEGSTTNEKGIGERKRSRSEITLNDSLQKKRKLPTSIALPPIKKHNDTKINQPNVQKDEQETKFEQKQGGKTLTSTLNPSPATSTTPNRHNTAPTPFNPQPTTPVRQLTVPFDFLHLKQKGSNYGEKEKEKEKGKEHTAICPICLVPWTHPCVSLCGHVCCEDCWANALERKLECPVCRKRVRKKQLTPILI